MTEHRIVRGEEWRAAREELLRREKEHTKIGDELARQRRELPWVRVEKEYRFDTDEGTRTLAELFDGRSQLVVYHFMFGPSYEAGCPACTSMGDTIVRAKRLASRYGTVPWLDPRKTEPDARATGPRPGTAGRRRRATHVDGGGADMACLVVHCIGCDRRLACRGAFAPELLDVARCAYVVLGAGYAGLAVGPARDRRPPPA